MPNPRTPAEAINGRLTSAGATALAALVLTRVFPSKPTQDAALPYVVFWNTSGDGVTTLGGRSGLQPCDVRAECYAGTQREAAAVLAEVVALLGGWRDRAIGVQGCFAGEDSDEQTLDDGTQVSGQTFRLWFKPQA